MSVLAGFLAQSAVVGYDRLYITADFDDYDPSWIDDLAYWPSGRSPGAAGLTENYPVSAAPQVIDGFVTRSYLDDFYFRIHITPPLIDIGNLLSVQTRDVSVWNAYFVDQDLAAIDELNTTGLTESGISAPYTFTPLLELTYHVTVDTNGPSAIDALYTFEFPLEFPTLSVIGRRVVVFPHKPNWALPVIERHGWLTDVLASFDGIEQRVGLREVPRRGLEFSVTTESQHESNVLDTSLIGWQARLFAVPVWTDQQELASALSAGSTSIPCVTAGYEFAADDLIVLWTDYAHYETVEIDSVGGSSLALKSATLATWPAATRLMPMRLGSLPAAQKLPRWTGDYYEGAFVFALADNPGFVALDSGPSYQGYRVYQSEPNWSGELELEHQRKLAVLDYDTGAIWQEDESGYASLLKPWLWTLASRAEIVALRGWLYARRGRQVPFWTPSQGADMTVTADIGASDGQIHIRNMGYQRLINGRADRRDIMLQTTGGAVYYRRITGAAEVDADNETVSIDSSLGSLVTVAEVAQVRFVHLSRLESDDIEIDWWQPQGVAECSAVLRSLPA